MGCMARYMMGGLFFNGGVVMPRVCLHAVEGQAGQAKGSSCRATSSFSCWWVCCGICGLAVEAECLTRQRNPFTRMAILPEACMVLLSSPPLAGWLQEFDKAVETYQAGLERDPDNQELKDGLMRCVQAINKVGGCGGWGWV